MFGGGFRQPQVTNLPFPHQLRHGSDGFLDRCLQVHAVLIIKIDHLDAEPPQTPLSLPPLLVRSAVEDAQECAILIFSRERCRTW